MWFYGIGQWFYSTQFPDDWLPCNGALIPSEYTAARAVLGNYMPDLRNRFLRVRGSQNIGLTEEDTLKAHKHTGPNHQHAIYYTAIRQGKEKDTNVLAVSSGSTTYSGYGGTGDTGETGDTETRPKSVYMAFCLYMKEGYPLEDKIDSILEICQKFDKSYTANEDEFHLSDELLNLCQTWFWTGQSRGG